MNSITVIGNIGSDPEIKFLESGTSVCKFSVADNQRKKDAPPIWWRVEVWGKSGEFVANYCRKGTKVAVSGSVKQDQWTSPEGEERKMLIINANTVEKLTSKADDELSTENSSTGVPQSVAESQIAARMNQPADTDIDSIPF